MRFWKKEEPETAQAYHAYSHSPDLICSYGPTAAQALLALGLYIHDNYGEHAMASGVSCFWAEDSWHAETAVYE